MLKHFSSRSDNGPPRLVWALDMHGYAAVAVGLNAVVGRFVI
jgi:hypothetical protein